MADLTTGALLKAIGPTATGDSRIKENDAGVIFGGIDGLGVIPDSAAFGLAISYNLESWGEVSFWNLTNNAVGAQGFYFRQKTGAGTYQTIMAAYRDPVIGYTELDLFSPTSPPPAAGANAIRLLMTDTWGAVAGAALPLYFDHNGGFGFADLAALDTGVGATLVVNDSNTDVLGTVITGTGAHAVLAVRGPTSWTVLGKLL